MSQYQFYHGADFLIMDAITKKPQTTRELAHLLQITDTTVVRRLKRFAEHVPPLVVKRWPDRKWVAAVVLRVETPRETVQATTGEKIVLPPIPKEVEPRVVGGRVVNVEAAPVAPVEEAVQSMPTPGLPPPEPKPYIPPMPANASEWARKISQRMRVPASLLEYGELSIGKIGKCSKQCGRTSVLWYGAANVCATCARGGR